MATITAAQIAALVPQNVVEIAPTVIANHVFWPGRPANRHLQTQDLTGPDGGISATFFKEGLIEADKLDDGIDYNRAQDPSLSSVTLTATEVGAQELITDLSKKALRSGGASAYVQRLVRNNLTACMTLFDRDVFSLAPGLNYGVGTTNTPLTNATILQAVYNAGLYNLPKPWGGFLHSTQWSQLVNESGSPFAAAAAAGVKAEEFYGNYYIGTFYDVEWWVSSSVSYTNGTTDRCGMILGGDGALGVVWSQMPETTVEHDQSRRADEMLTLAMWAVGEIDGTKGISITSRA